MKKDAKLGGAAEETARARLAAIVTSSNDAIISKSVSGVVETWNAAAERMFGYAANEILGASIRMLIPQDRQCEEDDILARIAGGEEVRDFETVRLTKDGTPVEVSLTVSPIHNGAGEIIGASKIVRDISERRKTLAKLHESEERFRTLADNISQLAWMADKDGYIFWYNRRWYEYTGTTLEDMKGWGWRKVHHPDHVDRVVARVQYSWDTGELWEDTFPLRSADGEFRWFLSRAMPIRNQAGEIELWFGTNTDVTDQKHHEEQIRLLMGEVNHRSKNLLSLVQAIARQTALPEEAAFVSRFSARLQALSAGQDVLIGSGWRGADLETLIRSQLAHFSDLIGERITLDGPPVSVNAAAAQTLGMAFYELATNAGKYGALSNAEGRVRVVWRTVKNSSDDEQFSIEWIESDGPRVEPPARRGFGSSVIERMSELSLDADVDFEFPPEGLQWRLTCRGGQLLDDPVQGAPRARRPSETTGAPTSRRVLVVEDEPVIGLDLMNTLSKMGYRVVGPAANVEEALQLLDEYACDIAVLDINLGAETSEPGAARLKQSRTPFITLSGYSEGQKPPAFNNVPHLNKPLEPDALQATLNTLSARFRAPVH